MATSFFCISPQMIQLFHECVEKKNYEEFYNHYKCDLDALSEKLKTMGDLPKHSVIKYCAHNFMDCFEHLLNSNREFFGDFHRSIEYAIKNKDWNSFYWENRDTADFIIRQARTQRITDIYVFDGVKEYLTFYDRDCDIAKKYTEAYLSKNNGVKLVKPSSIHEGYYEVEKIFETFAEPRECHYMTRHGELVYFTCSPVSHLRPYEYFLPPRHLPINQSYKNSRSIRLDYLQNLRKEQLRRKREERAERRRKHEEELSEKVHENREHCLMLLNCIGLKHKFENQDHNWKEWIIGSRQCIDKLLELFNQFVREICRNYKGLIVRGVGIEDKADLKTEITFLLKDIMNAYNSLEDSFVQLKHLERRLGDVMFIKVLKKCIAESASCLIVVHEAAVEFYGHASQENFQILQKTFEDLTPSLIYSTFDLRRICKDNSHSEIYEDVQFPNIPSWTYTFYALESCEMDENASESPVDPKAQPITALTNGPMSNVNKLHNSREPASPLEIKNESGVEDATKQATKLQKPVLEDFGVDRKRQERAERRRKLEEELRKLEEEDNEQLAVVSTIEDPESKNPKNSLRQEDSVPSESSVFLKPPMLDDLISDLNGSTTFRTAGPSSETLGSQVLEDLTPHLAEIEQETISTDSEISEDESEEDDFKKLIQEQAAHHREQMEQIMKKRAAQKKELEVINMRINAMSNIISNSS